MLRTPASTRLNRHFPLSSQRLNASRLLNRRLSQLLLIFIFFACIISLQTSFTKIRITVPSSSADFAQRLSNPTLKVRFLKRWGSSADASGAVAQPQVVTDEWDWEEGVDYENTYAAILVDPKDKEEMKKAAKAKGKGKGKSRQ
ncbi:hypothetical protein FRB99_000580 [Tulasnella sp. 403]|nr:hypothetical protein FRB99_000580 [Tulasnella sp. 403]